MLYPDSLYQGTSCIGYGVYSRERICSSLYCTVFTLLHSSWQTAMRASQAAGPLATWVRANVQYSVVLEKIEPLETEQAHLQK